MKKMKFLLVFTLLAGFSFTSCNNDDDDNDDSQTTSGNIVAKWTPTKTITQLNSQQPVSQDYTGNEEGCDNDYTEFINGGVLKSAVFFHNAANACEESANVTKTWTKNGNSLIITEPTIEGSQSVTYNIIKLTNSELQYTSSVSTGGSTLTVTNYFNKVN